jgi:HSP20 family protein
MISLSRAIDNNAASENGAYASGPLATEQRGVWFPPLDVYETESTFVVEMDIPGVHPENVEISFEQNALMVKGNRAATVKAPENGELRLFTSERPSGAFARAIRLPEYVDGEHIEAQYANGVLTVQVPKSSAARPRKIAIKAT